MTTTRTRPGFTSGRLMVVGFGGLVGSGKTTCATILRELAKEAGWIATKISFADALREELAQVLAVNGDPVNQFEDLVFSDHIPTRIQQYVTLMEDPATKDYFRPLMKWWGTEYRRALFGADCWVKKHANRVDQFNHQAPPGFNLLVTVEDVRYYTEANYLREAHNARMLEVVRRALTRPFDAHSSENELRDYRWDETLHNQENLKDLHTDLEWEFKKILGQGDPGAQGVSEARAPEALR